MALRIICGAFNLFYEDYMKKLFILLLILSLALTGCDVIKAWLPELPQGPDTDECADHTDSDDDGICDICYESVIVLIDLYSINDLHGKVSKSDSQPGLGGLTTYLKNNTDENSVLVSSGDMWQGGSESNLTYGAFITDWMSRVGFAAMTLGNHEYDWGREHISNNARLAQFPILAINVYEKSTGQRADYAEASVVIERGGIEIGIIGAIGDCYSSISGEVVGDVYFKVGDELTELVKAESERLRAQGVDFIIYSLHDGYGKSSNRVGVISNNNLRSYYDIELSDGYVDIVFEGHTHQSYVLSDTKGVYHLQGDGENRGIAHAELRYNEANLNMSVKSPEIIKSSVYARQDEDGLIGELLEKYKDEISAANRLLGYNPSYLSGNTIKSIVARLYYEAGVERWGGEYDIALGGGFISVRNPYNLKAGNVYYSDVYSILPFDNQLVLCSVSGYDLYHKFLTTSNSNYYVYGKNLESMKESIEFGKTYFIVTDTYTSTYAYNNLTEVARYTEGVFARDLFAAYIEELDD